MADSEKMRAFGTSGSKPSAREILNAILEVPNSVIRGIDTSFIREALPERARADVHKKAHYALLVWISRNFSPLHIFDLGTLWGASALALGACRSNLVESFDIKYPTHKVPGFEPPGRDNIHYHCENLLVTGLKPLLSADLILVDVNPHDGIKEQQIYDFLIKSEYKGLVIWDDIFLSRFPGMVRFWANIGTEKYDITKLGNPTGTGITIHE